MLVLRDTPTGLPSSRPIQQAKGRWFVEGANEIATYLAHARGIGIPH
ncbi:MAG: hypothetical protein U1F83_19595 [Verrucomicrobiota bacterium]